MNYRDPNVKFAGEENEIIVTVTTLGGHGMPAQDTAETIADAAPASQVDRRLLIDGRLVTADQTFPSVGDNK